MATVACQASAQLTRPMPAGVRPKRRSGDLTVGQPTLENGHLLRGNDLPHSTYTPLHRTREGTAGKWGLTGEVVNDGGERDNQLQGE
jgi:hypothetical protein